ncbi:MAG: YwmB family TATA-box binding protein [Bacillota bacterium]|nr:YwmB family TATA-box binding protein [Bacillota bacterium]
MKKVVYLLISITILLCIIFIIIHFENAQKSQVAGDILTKSFKAAGADFVKSELYFQGRVNDNDIGNINKFVGNISEKLGINENKVHIIDKSASAKEHKLEINDTIKTGKNLNLKIQLSENDSRPGESFISADVVENLSCEGLGAMIQKIMPVFYGIKADPKVTACITGTFNGKKDFEYLNSICVKTLKEVNAVKVEGINDGKLISISAYSSMIDDSIEVNRKKINLNLAMRYNNIDNKTYFWLATPIISTEY